MTYDPFIAISVPVIMTRSQNSTLLDCLDLFFAEEKLQNYFCIGCKRDSQNATLKVGIAKHPEILAIHLKRFQH